jgi:uncharacterized protein YjdB
VPFKNLEPEQPEPYFFTVGDADFVCTASAGSGTGTFSYSSSDPTVATIDPATGSVSILKAGTTTLTATKTGDANYNSASKDCTLTVDKGSQAAITYSNVTKAYGDTDFIYTEQAGAELGLSVIPPVTRQLQR